MIRKEYNPEILREIGKMGLGNSSENAAILFVVTQAKEKIEKVGAITEEEMMQIQKSVLKTVVHTIRELSSQ